MNIILLMPANAYMQKESNLMNTAMPGDSTYKHKLDVSSNS